MKNRKAIPLIVYLLLLISVFSWAGNLFGDELFCLLAGGDAGHGIGAQIIHIDSSSEMFRYARASDFPLTENCCFLTVLV